MALNASWLAALVVVVGIAMATRSDFAGTNGSAGPTIVGLTVPAILLATWRLREPLIASLTVLAAATVSCVVAWSVLHDESSTAAIGVPAPGIYAAFLVVIGVAIHARARRARKSE